MVKNMTFKQSACPLDCPDACTLDVQVVGGKVSRVVGSRVNPLTAGYICSKVAKIERHVHGPERLHTPMIRADDGSHFVPLTWDDALDRLVDRIADAVITWGGESVLPCSYGGSNGFLTEGCLDARLFQRLGATRVNRNLCALPSSAAAAAVYGKMPGIPLTDYEYARLIVIWGCNPHATGIHLLPAIRKARAAGALLVVVDPRRTQLAAEADLHLAVRPGMDLPLALSVIRWLFEGGHAAVDFLALNATGVDTLRERAAPWTLAAAADACGLPAADIERFCEMYAALSPAALRCGWGPERSRDGCSATAAILALPAVAGKFGVLGGGYTMSNSGAWQVDAAAAFTDPVAAGQLLPRRVPQSPLGRALTELDDPPVRVLFVYNCNPLVTCPDQARVRRGLARDDLFTVVFDAVMTDTAMMADLILPATTFLEHRDLARGYGALGMNRIRPVIPPVGESKPNAEVFGALIRRLGLARPGEPVTPAALERALLDTLRDGTRLERELHQSRYARPDIGEHPIQFVDVFPETDALRIRLAPEELDADGDLYRVTPDPGSAAYPLALISPATRHTISSTFGQLIKAPARVVVHPADAAARGVNAGDEVRIFNDLGEVRCLADVTDQTRPGVLSLPKGLWLRRTKNGATANALIPDPLTRHGEGACFNDARVQLERVP